MFLPPGIYIQLTLGPAKDPNARAFQFVGLAASLASLVKGCSDWWVRSKDGEEPTSLEKAKASVYFMPHLLFRTTAMTFCAAFMGYFFLAPVSLVLVVVIPIFIALLIKVEKDERAYFVIALPLTIVAPTALVSHLKPQRTLMKRTIIVTTSILLITLLFIFLLPFFVEHNDLVSTYGLRHLNFQSQSGAMVNL